MTPDNEKQLEGVDAGNENYERSMNLLRTACGPFYKISKDATRTCQCGCTNQEKK